jgi:hypothetical protein
VLVTDDQVERFLAQFRLDRLNSLQLSFASEYQGEGEFTARLTTSQMASVLQSPQLARIRNLTLGFHYLVEQAKEIAEMFDDPGMMPRLKNARLYSLYGGLASHVEGLRARLGVRLDAI